MIRSVLRGAAIVGAAFAAVGFASRGSATKPTLIPGAETGSALASSAGEETAIFSGGCFWGVQAVFQHMKGVTSALSGYTGGKAASPGYELVSTGTTNHAESVKVTFDPSKVSYADLLHVFFSVVHDPTELNFQGPDHGTQYRSAVWYTTENQKTVAKAYIDQLTKAKNFSKPIVTQVNPAMTFYPAEGYHQDYATIHPDDRYIVYNDAPKVVNLKTMFPTLYRDQPVLVSSTQP